MFMALVRLPVDLREAQEIIHSSRGTRWDTTLIPETECIKYVERFLRA